MLVFQDKERGYMNINLVKDEIKNHLGCSVRIKVFGNRNKVDEYIGNIQETYPYIFTVLINGESKSFSYADVITQDVVITYL